MEVKARSSLHQTPHFRSANPKYLSHCDTYKHRNCSSPSASPLTQAEHRLRAGTPPPQPALALTPFLISDFHLSAVNTPLYPNLNSETIMFFLPLLSPGPVSLHQTVQALRKHSVSALMQRPCQRSSWVLQMSYFLRFLVLLLSLHLSPGPQGQIFGNRYLF